jgi:transketolase
MSDRILIDIKKEIVKMAHYSCASHVGAALSVVDLLYVLYFKIVDINISNINNLNRDKVILSKGHASTALYAVLAGKGLINKEHLKYYYLDGGILPGHLDRYSLPGIDCSSGSLGHGLSIGIGMALANPSKNVYVILGDGECNEGSVWEGFMFAGHTKIKNLTVIIDKNELQGFGSTKDVLNMSNISQILLGFGLNVIDIDGHNIEQIERTLKMCKESTKVIVAHTVKGHGVSYMENELKWHYKSPNKEELKKALEEIEK